MASFGCTGGWISRVYVISWEPSPHLKWKRTTWSRAAAEREEEGVKSEAQECISELTRRFRNLKMSVEQLRQLLLDRGGWNRRWSWSQETVKGVKHERPASSALSICSSTRLFSTVRLRSSGGTSRWNFSRRNQQPKSLLSSKGAKEGGIVWHVGGGFGVGAATGDEKLQLSTPPPQRASQRRQYPVKRKGPPKPAPRLLTREWAATTPAPTHAAHDYEPKYYILWKDDLFPRHVFDPVDNNYEFSDNFAEFSRLPRAASFK